MPKLVQIPGGAMSVALEARRRRLLTELSPFLGDVAVPAMGFRTLADFGLFAKGTPSVAAPGVRPEPEQEG